MPKKKKPQTDAVELKRYWPESCPKELAHGMVGSDGARIGQDTIKRGGVVKMNPGVAWRLTATFSEITCEEEATQGTKPPRGFSHFDMTITRADPLLLARIKHGNTIRLRDQWEFEFEGDPAMVRRQSAIMKLTRMVFARDEKDENTREVRQWIALQYAARASAVLVRCARADASERMPVRRFDPLDQDATGSCLARDLDLDPALVSDTLERFGRFQEAINNLPDEKLTRVEVDRALGIESRDGDDAEYLALPDLTTEEAAEMERMKKLAMRHELDPDGQARLLPLLKRHTAHIKARLRIGKAR